MPASASSFRRAVPSERRSTIAGTTNNSGIGVLNNYFQSNVTLNFAQPLLKNFGRETTELNISVARFNKEGSLEQFKARLMSIISQVKTQYYQLYSARENLEVKKDLPRAGGNHSEQHPGPGQGGGAAGDGNPERRIRCGHPAEEPDRRGACPEGPGRSAADSSCRLQEVDRYRPDRYAVPGIHSRSTRPRRSGVPLPSAPT